MMNTERPSSITHSLPEGYLSEEGKRRYTLTVGIVAAVCFLAQFILPFILMMILMPTNMFLFMNSMTMPDTQNAAIHNGELWYTECGISSPSSSTEASLLKLSIHPDSKPEKICSISSPAPKLLQANDKLWIISKSSVQSYTLNGLQSEHQGPPLGDIFTPFLMNDQPAVLEKTPVGFSIKTLTSTGWITTQSFPRLTAEDETLNMEDIQIVNQDQTIHMFLKYGSTLYTREGFPTETEDITRSWKPVQECGQQWSAVIANGTPRLFASKLHGDFSSELIAFEHGPEGWTQILTIDQPLFGEFRAYPDDANNRILLFCGGMPNSMRVLDIQGANVIQNIRWGNGSMFPPGMMLIMTLPYLFMLFLPLLMAIIFSSLMRTHRVCQIQIQNQTVPFAPIWRRAVAQGIDILIAFTPVGLGYGLMMSSFMDMEKMMTTTATNPFQLLASFGLVFCGFGWSFICLLLFAFTEGKWGISPGKWITRIRVVSIEDLQPCGFGRAFLRSILKVVDGFFNFMVAVMLIALTEKWQRLGDMAARTVVINYDAPRKPISGNDL